MNDQERILTLLLRLQSGERLSKRQLSDEFGVSPKTIQRDFSLLGNVLERHPSLSADLVYDKKSHTRFLQMNSVFNKKEILIIIKILLENRTLNKAENKALIDGLLGLISKDNQRIISRIIGSELLNYTPLSNTQDRIDKIWKWSDYIYQESVLDISYQSPYSTVKSHTILPVSLYYDNHYFYIVAYNLRYDSYMTLKLDRILAWKKSTEKKPVLSYGRKFRDGDVRHQHVDAFLGEPINVVVDFCYDPEIILDQFPEAKMVILENGTARFSFTSQNTPGLMRWLLSQADGLTVVQPQKLIEQIKMQIERLKEKYI